MPELPEVESVRRQLEEQILGKTLKSVSTSRLSLRKPFLCSSAKIKNHEVTGLKRWGKRLFVSTKDKQGFDISLGMTGSFRFEKTGFKKQKHDHIIFNFQNKESIVYNDPRRFGWVQYGEKFEEKGWDPILSSKKDFKFVREQALKTEVNAYSFLMNQKYIVGLGNIYVQEILFKAGVSPFRKIKSCSDLEFDKIQKSTKAVLNLALKHGGSTILNYKNAKGESGAFQQKLKVYGKKKSEPCVVCGSPIIHVQTARAICYCPVCQP